ncbi:MAG: ABC transporter ATP-binding protein [Candidatus Omnitrophica bacterium]|nr:ABC transporter ATP-binding protein [Candidatus Omnitrophota bacterium]
MLLEIKNLKKYFVQKDKGLVRAVDGVSLGVRQGESIGIVGESGCGKTTLAKIIMGLTTPDQGSMLFEGQEVWGQRTREVLFRRRVRMVFQDPYASLDPRFSVYSVLREALCLEAKVAKGDEEIRMKGVLQAVGLSGDILSRFPHEFSGGERQRISIARALMTDPSLLILDEAVSALDVLIQKEILDLLVSLQKTRSITEIFISHNLSAVRRVAQKIVVMYQGKIVEYGSVQDIFNDPRHSYTQRLLDAAIHYRVQGREDIVLKKEAVLLDIGQEHLVLSS